MSLANVIAQLKSPDPERVAIQEEGAEVSTIPAKPVPSLQEQAKAILEGYGADWKRGVTDLRIVAMNHVLADLVEKVSNQTPPGMRILK